MEHLAGVRGKGANPVGGLCGKGNGPVQRIRFIYYAINYIIIIIMIMIILIIIILLDLFIRYS